MTPQTFMDNFGHLAEGPNGIQMLRELILQLAVQGKLVSQDPDDESVVVWFDKMNELKQKHYKVEGIRTEKTLPKIKSNEIPFDIPLSWKWNRLGETTIYKGRQNHEPNQLVSDRWMLELEDIEKSSSRLLQRITVEQRRPKSTKTSFRRNDVLYGKLRPYLDKVIVADEAGYSTTEIVPIVVLEGMDPYYLRWILKSPYFITYVNNKTYGINLPRLNTTDARMTLIPVAPLPEQKRIVAKVDQLMALCDELEQQQQKMVSVRINLNKASLHSLTTASDPSTFQHAWHRIADHFDILYDTPATIQELRQAILQLAVQGKLVPQAPSDDSAEALVNAVHNKKEQLLSTGELKRLPPIPKSKLALNPFLLPSNWEWVRFEDLTIISSGVTKGRKLEGRKLVSLPYLRVANVQRGHLDLSMIKEIEIAEDEIEKFSLQSKDLLITEGGDWDKVGRTCIWNLEIPLCIHQNHVFKARKLLDEQNEKWLELYLNSVPARDYFAGSSKQTTNLASINKTQLRACPVPIPPLEEQKRIVEKVDQLMALCDDLEAKLTQSRSHSEKLMDAIVHNLVNGHSLPSQTEAPNKTAANEQMTLGV